MSASGLSKVSMCVKMTQGRTGAAGGGVTRGGGCWMLAKGRGAGS